MDPQIQTATSENLTLTLTPSRGHLVLPVTASVNRQDSMPMPRDVAEKIHEAASFEPVDPYDLWATRYEDDNPSRYSAFFNATDMVLRQVYRHLLLRIPSMYFSRVSRVFRTAHIGVKDVVQLRETRERETRPSQELVKFNKLWVDFIDQLIKEWKTFNVIAALLLSAILTLLQIQVANQTFTRTTAFISLVDAIMGLVYGCLFIVRFGTMKSKWKAASFAEVMHKTKGSIWWNVLVMLSLPAVWLSWSLIFFCIAIMSFVWTDGDGNDDTATPPRNSSQIRLGTRIAISVVFAAGLLYLYLIIRTFRFELYKGEAHYLNSTEQFKQKAWKMFNTLAGRPLPTNDVTSEISHVDIDRDEWFEPNIVQHTENISDSPLFPQSPLPQPLVEPPLITVSMM